MGQESEFKAAKWIRENWKQKEHKNLKKMEFDLTVLQTFRKRRNGKEDYFRYLVEILKEFLKEEKISKKYKILIQSTDKGIVARIKNTKYYSAFAPCGIPVPDYFACKTFAVKTGNTTS